MPEWGHLIFQNLKKMGIWSVSQKLSGFKRFVGISYLATFGSSSMCQSFSPVTFMSKKGFLTL